MEEAISIKRGSKGLFIKRIVLVTYVFASISNSPSSLVDLLRGSYISSTIKIFLTILFETLIFLPGKEGSGNENGIEELV